MSAVLFVAQRRQRRRARVRGGGASRDHPLRRARRADRRGNARPHARQSLVPRASMSCSSSRSRSTRRSGCATCCANGRHGAAAASISRWRCFALAAARRSACARRSRCIRHDAAPRTGSPASSRRCCIACPGSRLRSSCRCTFSRSARRSTAPTRSTSFFTRDQYAARQVRRIRASSSRSRCIWRWACACSPSNSSPCASARRGRLGLPCRGLRRRPGVPAQCSVIPPRWRCCSRTCSPWSGSAHFSAAWRPAGRASPSASSASAIWLHVLDPLHATPSWYRAAR